MLQNYPVAAVLAIGVVFVNSGGFYIATTFALSYLTGQLGLSRIVALVVLLLASAGDAAGILMFARVADRVGKRPVATYLAATSLITLVAVYLVSESHRMAIHDKGIAELRTAAERG